MSSDTIETTAIPAESLPYSHELDWPNGLEPFKVVDDGSQGDPYAHYRFMVDEHPILRCATPTGDVYMISRYADVRKALRTPKVFSSQVVTPPPLTFVTLLDAPYHTKIRTVIAPSFTPKAIARFEEGIYQRAEILLDQLIAKGGGDIVDEFAIPLSMTTISALLDVPAEDQDLMKFWSDEAFSYFGRLARKAPGTGTDEESSMKFFQYLRDRMEVLYAEGNDSIGGEIAKRWKAGDLSDSEAGELCAFVFVAGHDTTTILIANAFMMLAQHPELIERLRNNPEEVARFVEETVRFRGTVQRASRITTQEVEMSGVVLPKGAVVRLMTAAAGRDFAQWPDADTFDMDRDPDGHTGFGAGVHMCAGAPLARMETIAGVQVAVKKLASLELDPERPITWVRGNNLTNSGPETLFVTMEALS